MTEEFTVEKILRHLQIEEENKKRGKHNSNVNYVSGNNKKKGQKWKNGSDSIDKQAKKKNRKCYCCNEKGHYIKDCKKIEKENAKKGASSSANTNMVQEEVKDLVAMVSKMEILQIGMVTKLHMTSTKSVDWWLDSGTTVHVCNDKGQFKSYEETANREVLMENHSAAKVLGKGSVDLNFTSGKKPTLKNVLHVHEIKKNLVSATLLCKNGFKVVLKSDHVVLSKNGLFVGKGYSCEGMFKLNVEIMNKMNVVSV